MKQVMISAAALALAAPLMLHAEDVDLDALSTGITAATFSS